MESWDRESVVAWLRERRGQQVKLAQRGGTFAVLGACQGIDDLDACVSGFQACHLVLAEGDTDVSISFHEDSLAIHLLLREKAGGQTLLSMSTSLPYDRVLLTVPGEEEPAAEEEIRSPYELLH